MKMRQKTPITTSPPRAQSLLRISFFRSSRAEDASCADDMLASTLLEADKNSIRSTVLEPAEAWMLSVPASIPFCEGESPFTERGA